MTTEYADFEVRRDGARDLKFKGILIADVASHDERAMEDGYYSGSTGRWAELELYKTAKGTFIAVEIGRTRYLDETDRYSAEVCATESEVIDFLGDGWLAKKLYAQAGIDACEVVE
jgi:hypothetical protein